MTSAIGRIEQYPQVAAGIYETMRRTMVVAFDCSSEPDPIHLAYTDGYEKGFTDAVSVLNLALGLAHPGGMEEAQPWPTALAPGTVPPTEAWGKE
jgi:hypothetical protein